MKIPSEGSSSIVLSEIRAGAKADSAIHSGTRSALGWGARLRVGRLMGRGPEETGGG